MTRFAPLRVRPERFACGILVLAFTLRIWYWRAEWSAPLIIYGDEGIFYGGGVTLARDITGLWSSDVWHLWHSIWLEPPLYPIWLSLLIRFLGEDPLALRAFQVLLGTLTVALVCRLGRALFNRWIGAGAAMLVALHAPLVNLPVLLMTENLFILLLVAAFLCLIEFARRDRTEQAELSMGNRRQPLLLFCAGWLLALATLTRSNPSLFFVLVVLWLFAIGHFKWRATLSCSLWFALGAVLVFLP
jgi:4-amino-4-deoxy-L-arabinose transferase-like glycosyltransferase